MRRKADSRENYLTAATDGASSHWNITRHIHPPLALEGFQPYWNIFVFFKPFKTHSKFTLFHSREPSSVLWMAQAASSTSTLLSNAIPYGQSDSHAHKIPTLNPATKKENVKKKRNVFIYMYFFPPHSVHCLYRSHSQTHASTYTPTQDGVSSSVWPFPAVDSAKFNQALLFTVAMVLWWCRQKLN